MRRLLAALFLLCLPVLYSNAQNAVSQVSGTVLDASGGAVAGAEVQIVNTDTNAVRTAQTSDTGFYTFPGLPIGPYKLQVTKQGFTTYIQSGIVLQVNVNPAIDVTLKVGTVTQEVQVQANAAMVETQTTGVGQIVQPEQVVDLPLNGRQVSQLIALSGGAVATTGGAAGLDYVNTVSYSVAGSQNNATMYYLDGSDHMDTRVDIGLPYPFPDAVQEFNVESSTLPADYGMRPGGTVNALTKSGTNAFHGDAFEFLRNYLLDARPAIPVNTPRDSLKRNQFGGTIGGPIKKDKLFFFTGYQGTYESTAAATSTAFVPTAAVLAGDFRAILAAPCQTHPITLSEATLPNLTTSPGSNIINTSLYPFNPVALKYVTTYLPISTNPCGTITYGVPTLDNEKQSISRVDYHRTANDELFARYFITNYFLDDYFCCKNAPNILTASNTGLSERVQAAAVGDTHVISARTISSFRFSFVRSHTTRIDNPTIPTLSSLGSNVTSLAPNDIRGFGPSGYFSGLGDPGFSVENTFSATENIGLILGSHQLGFGGTWIHKQMNDLDGFQINSNLSWNGLITGSTLADFLLGTVTSFSQGNNQVGRDGQDNPSLYFQDSWKATRRVQVNAGIRWDPLIPQHSKYKLASMFNATAFANNVYTQQFTNAPPGITFPGDPGFNGKSDFFPDWKTFAPRLGVVWDPRGNGRESIRAGYGMFYDTSIFWNTQHIVLNPPWGETVSFTPALPDFQNLSQGGGTSNPWFGIQGGNPFPTPPPQNFPKSWPFPLNGTYVFESPAHPSATYVQQWNLALQKQFSGNWLASVTYIGNETNHQWLGLNLDPAVYLSQYGTTLPCTLPYNGFMYTFNPCNSANGTAKGGAGVVSSTEARRALALENPVTGAYYGGGIHSDEPIGSAAYNGLLLSLQHRLSQNFSVLSNFTWSHCFNEGQEGEDIGNAFSNPSNPKADWGNCTTDRRKVLNLSVVALMPKFSSRVLDLIVGHWQASTIFTRYSGSYINVSDGTDISLTGNGSDRPNQVGNPFAAGTVAANPTCSAPTAPLHTQLAWFNNCAYMKQPAGTFGNTNRDSLLGPGSWNLDSAIWRTFPLRESVKLDFRVEAFNTMNNVNLGNPSAALNSGTLGKILTQNGSPRIMQAALKLTF